MDCKHIQEHLIDLLYQELEPDQLDQIEGHLKGCDGCSAELAAFEATRSAMRELPELEPPPSLSQALMREAARAVTPAVEQGFWERLRAGLRMMVMHPAMTAAVALVVVFGVSFMVYRGGGGPKSLTPRADDLPPVSSTAPATVRPAPGSTATEAPRTQQLVVEGRPPNNELGRLAKTIDQPGAAVAEDKHEKETRGTITKGGRIAAAPPAARRKPRARPRPAAAARPAPKLAGRDKRPKTEPAGAKQPARRATKSFDDDEVEAQGGGEASLLAAKGDRALAEKKCELAFRYYDQALRADKSLAKRLGAMIKRCTRRVGSQQLAQAQKRYPALAGWFRAEARERAAISRKRQADQRKAAPPADKRRTSDQRQAPATPRVKPPK